MFGFFACVTGLWRNSLKHYVFGMGGCPADLAIMSESTGVWTGLTSVVSKTDPVTKGPVVRIVIPITPTPCLRCDSRLNSITSFSSFCIKLVYRLLPLRTMRPT